MAMHKKLKVILPLYLAGIIMLAFAVLPHHHHSELICFTPAQCTESTETATSHDHDSNLPHEGCVRHLFQTQVTRSLSLSDDCPDGHCHHFTAPLILTSLIFELLSLDAGNYILPDTAYREKLHAILRTNDLAGRAPPFQG